MRTPSTTTKPTTAADPRYRALAARDRRFDGRFFFAVTSTGIYCRPICPARTPKPQNVRFFPSAAGAQAAGFRACLRCRPHLAPASEADGAASWLADRALRLIAGGALDGADGPDAVAALARTLHVSDRHLRRVMAAHVGTGPLAVAKNRRAQTARLLLETTALPITDVAFSAGFGSVRQFNDAMRAAFGRTPSALRSAGPQAPAGAAVDGTGALVLRAGHPGECDLDHLISWFAVRAVGGVEHLGAHPAAYQRTVRLPHGPGVITLAPGNPAAVTLTVDVDDVQDLGAAITRCRRLADLDADTGVINAALAADPALAPLVARRPGLRIPGCVDGFEMAVRAVLGQQVSVAAARTLAGRLVARHGAPYAGRGPLTRLFPTAEDLADADLDGLGLTGTRKRTINVLAHETASGALDLGHDANRADTRAALLALPGIGPWTADYLALRALADPDAFPVGDLVLRQSAARLGLPSTQKALLAYAERWRPWRGYAAMHLWADHGAVAGTAPKTPIKERS